MTSSSPQTLVGILILLKLTVAFDTINHITLLSCFESHLNITGTALSWLMSHLTNNTTTVNINSNNITSSTTPLSQGVPQGSVLGPLLFILYMLPLDNVIRCHGLHFHCYADDYQLYISTKSITTATHSTPTNCLTEIKSCIQVNFLKLNYDKSDKIIICPKSLTKSNHNFCHSIDNSSPHTSATSVSFSTASSHLNTTSNKSPELPFSV